MGFYTHSTSGNNRTSHTSPGLETGMFGPTMIQNSILNGSHYSCSLEAQQLLAEAMQRLLYKEFFDEKGVSNYCEELELLDNLKKGTASRNISESHRLLAQFQTSSKKLVSDMNAFINGRSASNENFKFWYQFLERHTIVLDLLWEDWEGSWELHLEAMQRALYEFAAWDSTNYLWWGSVYLEDAKNLSITAPSVIRNLSGAIPSQSRTNLVDFQQLAVIKSWSRQSIYHQSAVMVWSVMLSRSNTWHNGISCTMRWCP